MQITRFSDLNLRILLYLASRDHPMDATVTTRAASELLNVPYTHMVKVVHQLGVRGYVTTSKGKGGGLRLSRSPSDIRVGDVLRTTEPPVPVVDCVTQACPIRSNCALKRALDEAHSAFYGELNRYTLADVSKTPVLEQLVRLSP